MRQTRRTISSDLQIYFDESGKAQYRSAAGRELRAVKLELEDWQAFVEKWLQAVEEPAPVTSDQQQLKGRVEETAALLKGPAFQLSDEGVAEVLLKLVPIWCGQLKNLKFEQVESIIRDVISSL